jgi:hypothetical protein
VSARTLEQTTRKLLAQHHVREILRAFCDEIEARDRANAAHGLGWDDDEDVAEVLKTAIAMLPVPSEFGGVAFRMGSPADALAIAHAAWDEGDDAEDAGHETRAKAAWAICREADAVVQAEVRS